MLLEKTARKPGDYLPGRRSAPDDLEPSPDHMQILGVMNFKGGSGKTTTAAHLAQRLALKDYRDPQASLITLHSVQPEIDLPTGAHGTTRSAMMTPARLRM